MIFLPGLLIAIVVGAPGPDAAAGHLRAGAAAPGTPTAFFPAQTARDVTVVTVVLIALFALAWRGMPAMEGPADPTDATFIPRPEWYFLGLFQLLKYFPGKLEVVGAVIIPTVLGALLALLPWLDRGPDRDPRRRRVVMLGGRRRRARGRGADHAGLARQAGVGGRGGRAGRCARSAGGSSRQTAKCARCHSESGMAEPARAGVAVARPGVADRATSPTPR